MKKIKKNFKKKTRERYQNLSKEEKEEKKQQQNGREHYKIFSKDGKQKLVEYRKTHYRMRKNVLL